MKSWKTPTREQVDRVVALLGHAEQYRYFFDRLENPEWIQPLMSKGFFRNPPEPERDKARGTTSFPPWAESRYLARVASLRPELVVDVICQIPDTENVRVYEDLADAALKMPAELAARLLGKTKIWARSPYPLLLPEKLGSLVAHLANGRQTEAASDLARVLLEVLPDPRTKRESETEETYRLTPEPRAGFDPWHYERILKKDLPELLKAAGVPALELMCDLLEAAIRLSRRRGDDQGPEDYSYVWRPAIEDHPQNRPHGLKDILVSGVRDAAERLSQIDMSRVPEIVRLLEARRWRIFHRIALHILRRFPDASPKAVALRLTDRALFDDAGVRHEYALLIGDHFDRLAPEQQQAILGWIGEGPDLQKFKEAREQWTGNRPTEQDLARYRKTWQRDRLAWFRAHLPEDWKRRYEALAAECGEPEHPEFGSYSVSWVGPTSPKSAEELQAMSTADIVEFLKAWRPEESDLAPSPEGLGRVLSSVVSQDARRFVAQATRFCGLEPTYVRALISGFREGLKQKQALDWSPVLDLCRWVVSQPREIREPCPRKAIDADPHWGSARKSIAELLAAGFAEGRGSIPIEQRTTVWEILRPLTEDPDPTPEHEARYGGSNMDPATLSINTTRGEAMHTLVRYALWVRRHLEKSPDASERIGRGLDEMPEVRDVLDDHLDVSRDPSVAIRAVYGQWFPWLVRLDHTWARNRVAQIFPTSDSETELSEAAWETYITFCRPYDNVFKILRGQYVAAVDRFGVTLKKKWRLADCNERIAEHLMTFYWRGKLDSDDAEGLLTRFWANATDALRGHALEFIGRSLRSTKEAVPPEILERLKLLWERRLAVAKAADTPQEHSAEMTAFGWWFVSGKFEDRWAMAQLSDSLKMAGKVEPDHRVAEGLARLVQTMPREVVNCLELMAKGDREGWRIYSWRACAKLILARALQTDAAHTAEKLIHYLGSRGYLEFRDLLRRA